MSFNDLEQGFGSSRLPRANNQSVNASPVDNDDKEYIMLKERVTHQILIINGNIKSIERLVDFIGTPKESQDTRNKLHEVSENTRRLIKDSTSDMKKLAQYQPSDTGRFTDRNSNSRKLEYQKMSRDFQKILEWFQEVQRVAANKQREYVDKTKAKYGRLQAEVMAVEHDEEEAQHQAQAILAEDTRRRIQLSTLDNEIQYNEAMISEREGEIQGIEQGITELNEIFRDLGMLVSEQESGIQSIYSNVVNIAQNTRQAADELTVANRHQKNARKNMCCLMLIVSVVACVLALIIVVAK